jgi:DNA-directed RNA polymerase specialized sigma24 family protein
MSESTTKRRPCLPDHIEIRHPDKAAIVAALSPDVVRRMRNWVDWKGGGGRYSTFTTDYDSIVISDGYREASMPILVAEAQQTDRALKTIPDELGTAVALFWLGGEDMSYVEMGGQLGCSDKTCKARILRGHQVLILEIYRPVAQPSATA